jgi:hypothetical protein
MCISTTATVETPSETRSGSQAGTDTPRRRRRFGYVGGPPAGQSGPTASGVSGAGLFALADDTPTGPAPGMSSVAGPTTPSPSTAGTGPVANPNDAFAFRMPTLPWRLSSTARNAVACALITGCRHIFCIAANISLVNIRIRFIRTIDLGTLFLPKVWEPGIVCLGA